MPATFEVNPKLPTNFDSNSASTEVSKSQVIASDTPPSGTSGHPNVYQISHSVQPTDGAVWLLEGTMHNAYVEHEPNAMFPDASSTVPNATLTQQRVMDGIHAPAFLGSDVDIESAPFQPDASIPWSEYLRSPTGTTEHPRSSAKDSYTLQATGNSSSHSTLTQRRPISREILGCPQTQCSRNFVNAHKITPSSNGGPPSQETIRHAHSQRKCTSSSSVTPAHGEAQSSTRQTVTKKRSPSPEQGSDDDLADLGAPKEQ
jgi:hypothetical protein